MVLCRWNTSRPDEKGLDTAGGPVLEEFKVSYGGDQEDDVPATGAKRSAGGSVRGVGSWHGNGLQQYCVGMFLGVSLSLSRVLQGW